MRNCCLRQLYIELLVGGENDATIGLLTSRSSNLVQKTGATLIAFCWFNISALES
jgi:hypothetical protein